MAEHPPADVYALLGAPPEAGDDELHRAYRRAARLAHPDTGAPVAAFHALQAAWEQVRTPERRAAYDVRRRIAAPVLSGPRPALPARPPDGWPASMIDRRSGTDRRGSRRGADRRRVGQRFVRPAAQAPARFARFDAGAPDSAPLVDARA